MKALIVISLLISGFTAKASTQEDFTARIQKACVENNNAFTHLKLNPEQCGCVAKTVGRVIAYYDPDTKKIDWAEKMFIENALSKKELQADPHDLIDFVTQVIEQCKAKDLKGAQPF